MNTKGGGRRTALASFPRSGNTWVRFLLEQATGERCGSIYQDRIMPRGPEGIVIKTHDVDSHKYTHAVHLVRNPYDAIDSYFHAKVKVGGVENLDWEQHVYSAARQWRSHTEHWRNADCERYRIRYEDLLRDTQGELTGLLLWLGYGKITMETIKAAVKASTLQKMRKLNAQFGNDFFRSGSAGTSHASYTAAQITYIQASLKDFLPVFGYDNRPLQMEKHL